MKTRPATRPITNPAQGRTALQPAQIATFIENITTKLNDDIKTQQHV